jgi:FkbM family methyltransferase
MKSRDIEIRNAETLAILAKQDGSSGEFYGYVNIDFLPCEPFVMFNGNDCSVASRVLAKGNFEPTSLRLWCQLAAAATGIVDIGAYTGIYALAAAAIRRDLTILAFEPNPFSLARLRMNVTVNKLWNVQEYYSGIADTDGLATLNWVRKRSRSLSSNATFASMAGLSADRIESAVVQVRTLNDPQLCNALGSRPLLKVDVEGAEASTFKGLTAVLERKPDIIVETFNEAACETINGLVAGYGYRTYLINETDGGLEPRDRLRPCDPKSESMNQLLTTRTQTFKSGEAL